MRARYAQNDSATQPPTLDPARQVRARSYARSARLLYVIEAVTALALIAVVAFSGPGRLLARALAMPRPFSAATLFAAVLIAYAAVTLPLSYCRSFILPRRYGLGTQRAGTWLAGRSRRALLAALLGGTITAFAYWAMEALPSLWWLLTGLLVLLVTVALNLLAPVAVMPLFFRCSPLRDDELSRRLSALSGRAGTRILGVFTMERSRRSAAANAMLVGLGRTRRIVVSEGLSRSYSYDEIEAAISHELGHHAHRDIPRLILLQSGLGVLGFFICHLVLRAMAAPLGLAGMSDAAGLPFLVLVLTAFWLATGPLASAYVRRLERLADAYALRLSGNADAFISLMTKLANQNLNEADPGRLARLLFYDHPPYRERVEMAESYRHRVAAREGVPC